MAVVAAARAGGFRTAPAAAAGRAAPARATLLAAALSLLGHAVTTARRAHARHFLALQVVLHDRVEALLHRCHERQGPARAAGAARAARTVDVVLDRQREVEVDDQFDVVDVDAARGDVGRDQEARLAARERLQAGVTRLGALVAVDRVGGQASAAQRVAEPLAADLLVDEDQHAARLAAQQLLERTLLVDGVHGREAVRDRLRRLAARTDLHALGAGQEVGDERLDFLRQRRREQEILPFLRQAHEDAADLRHEAHVEHAVGFVEHHHLHAFERQVAAFEVVDEAARARDHDVAAALEGRLLDRHVDAAERRADRQAGMLRVDAQVLGHLHAQFARRHDDEATQAGFTAAEAVEHRQAEGRRLAAAGLAEADQFGAGEDLGNGTRLDVRRLFVAGGANTTQDGLLQPKGSKSHAGISGAPRCIAPWRRWVESASTARPTSGGGHTSWRRCRERACCRRTAHHHGIDTSAPRLETHPDEGGRGLGALAGTRPGREGYRTRPRSANPGSAGTIEASRDPFRQPPASRDPVVLPPHRDSRRQNRPRGPAAAAGAL
jgi:hypothetical protein